MSGYQQPGAGLDAGSGDIGVSLVGGAAAEDFGESAALGAASPYHSEGAVVGVVFNVVSALCVVRGTGKLRQRRMMARYVDRQRGPECSAESWCAPLSDPRICQVKLAFRTIRGSHGLRRFWPPGASDCTVAAYRFVASSMACIAMSSPVGRLGVVKRTPGTSLWRVVPRAGPP